MGAHLDDKRGDILVEPLLGAEWQEAMNSQVSASGSRSCIRFATFTDHDAGEK